MPLLADIQNKRQERAQLIKEAEKILIEAKEAGRDMSPEEEERFDRLHEDVEKKYKDIQRLERQLSAEETLEPLGTRAGGMGMPGDPPGELPEGVRVNDPAPPDPAENYETAFRSWVRHGMAGVLPEMRASLFEGSRNPYEGNPELRAQSVGTPAAGGYLVPTELASEIEVAMLAFGGVQEAGARVVTTAGGNQIPWPTQNDTGNKGERIAENAQHNTQDVAFGQVLIDSYMYSSKIVLVSIQLLQDNAFNFQADLGSILAERIGRIQNEEFTTGTGSSQPNGVVTASVLGKTGTTGQTTSIIYDDVIDLEHSVDPAYRRHPTTGFMFHDTSLKALKKLVDTQSRPLWGAGLNSGDSPTLDGYRYTINQDMPVMAASAKSVLFGQFNKYLIRKVQGIIMLRLVERYADYLQVGFLSFQRADADLIDAGTNPIKHYANSAT